MSDSDVKMPCSVCGKEQLFKAGSTQPVCGSCVAKGSKVDPFVKLRQELDQRSALMREVPPLLWAFFQQLKGEGFTNEEALILTKAYFLHTVGGSQT